MIPKVNWTFCQVYPFTIKQNRLYAFLGGIMRTKKKKILMVSLLVISVLTSIFTSVFASAKIVPSDDGGENALSSNYYYTNLITTVNGTEQEYTLAKKFYQALEEMNQKVLYGIPMGKRATGDDLANAVLYLASKEASGHVTAITLNVSGGCEFR